MQYIMSDCRKTTKGAFSTVTYTFQIAQLEGTEVANYIEDKGHHKAKGFNTFIHTLDVISNLSNHIKVLSLWLNVHVSIELDEKCIHDKQVSEVKGDTISPLMQGSPAVVEQDYSIT